MHLFPSQQFDSVVWRRGGVPSGEFVGMVSDNPDEKIDLKVFHGDILNDHEAIRKEEEGYVEIGLFRAALMPW